MHENNTHIDDELLAEASLSVGVKEKTAIVRLGLEALIEREAARRLAAFGGSMPLLKVTPRHRTHGSR